VSDHLAQARKDDAGAPRTGVMFGPERVLAGCNRRIHVSAVSSGRLKSILWLTVSIHGRHTVLIAPLPSGQATRTRFHSSPKERTRRCPNGQISSIRHGRRAVKPAALDNGDDIARSSVRCVLPFERQAHSSCFTRNRGKGIAVRIKEQRVEQFDAASTGRLADAKA